MNDLAQRTAFREKIMGAQEFLRGAIANGDMKEAECPLEHFFTPIDEKYGCATYARKIFLPKGSVVIGKIHRHQHLNFVMQGKVSVATEFGKKYIEAPAVFVSEVGLKRAVYAEEDTIWVTVHLVGNVGEENLDKIEDEVIAPDYAALGQSVRPKELSKTGVPLGLSGYLVVTGEEK